MQKTVFHIICFRVVIIRNCLPLQLRMRTDAGIWRLSTQQSPYRLEHINLIKTPNNRTEFHRQPRTFLSFTDVVRYIKKHDGDLLSSHMRHVGVANAV